MCGEYLITILAVVVVVVIIIINIVFKLLKLG